MHIFGQDGWYSDDIDSFKWTDDAIAEGTWIRLSKQSSRKPASTKIFSDNKIIGTVKAPELYKKCRRGPFPKCSIIAVGPKLITLLLFEIISQRYEI